MPWLRCGLLLICVQGVLRLFMVSHAAYGGEGASGADGAHLASPGALSLGLLVSCQAASCPGSTWLVCMARRKLHRAPSRVLEGPALRQSACCCAQHAP